MERRPIRVALSGGGVRAALFDLGLLLYLVDAGLNTDVDQIASVSGGSITNAFVAQRCDFRRVTREEFDPIAGDLLVRLVRRGIVGGRHYAAMAAVAIALGATGSMLLLGGSVLGLPRWAGIPVLLALGALALLRGHLLEAALRRAVLDHPGAPRTLGAVVSSVEHLFCTTDLRTGMPFYFSTAAGGHVYSPVLGFAACDHPLASIVRASAAFPGGVPARRYTSPHRFFLTDAEVGTQLEMTGNWSLGHYRPRTFLLVDGGVWNNLGTQAFLEHHLWFGPDRMDHGARKRTAPDGVVVVSNASAPVRVSGVARFHLPFVAEAASFSRAMQVVASNTVAPRIDALRRRPEVAVVSILDHFGRALSQLDRGEVIRRLPDDCDVLRLWRAHRTSDNTIGDMDVEFGDRDPWRVYDVLGENGKAATNTDVPTTLARIARWRAVLLVAHAYENAQAELAVAFGCPVPSTVTRRDRFDDLLPETARDRRRDVRGDRASRARRRRQRRTTTPRQV